MGLAPFRGLQPRAFSRLKPSIASKILLKNHEMTRLEADQAGVGSVRTGANTSERLEADLGNELLSLTGKSALP